mgnify:CR=1 FL=1
MKLGRNDACWCGSGLKYKKCHSSFDDKIEEFRLKGAIVPDREMIKTKEQIEGIRRAGILNTAVLDEVANSIREGISTEEINRIVHDFTIRHGGIPAPLNYEGSTLKQRVLLH